MRPLRHPIGIQTFSDIIGGGYAYVDKTHYIKPLISHSRYLFLSRPRRFGKSLLLSTLESYFEGRRELFKGLDIDSMDMDWTPSPVLHLDFNAENYTLENGLEVMMDTLLRNLERRYGNDPAFITPAQRFRHLIQAAYEQTGHKVVVLVDEYDKPLLAIEHRQDLLPAYAPVTDKTGSPFNFTKFLVDLHQGRPDDFMRRLAALLKDLPGEDHCESSYRAVTYLVAVLCTPHAIAEHRDYLGRSDIEVLTNGYVYLFEFKYNRSVREAMDQILTRDYIGSYEMEERKVYLIAANFVETRDERGLHYEIKTINSRN